MANEDIDKAMALMGRSFEYVKRQYDVTMVKQAFGKVSIHCVQRTFVWDVVQLADFLSQIRVIDENGPLKPEFVPNKEKITLKQNAMSELIVQQADAGVSVADKLTTGLMAEFEILSGTPTEADFKRAEAKSKVAHTVISIEQTKIGYLKLKNGK